MTGHWLDGAPMDPTAASAEPLPTIAGFPFLHAGCAALVVGPTGGGRSSLVQACAYDAARAGVRVAYLGSEITEGEFNARAASLAAKRGDLVDDALRQQLALVRYLNLASAIAAAWDGPAEWARGVAGKFDVVVIDPLSAVASTLGLDFDKSNAEFVRFYDSLVQPIAAAGVAVVMLENVGHSIESKSRAKGASAKSDRADLTFSCSLQAHSVGLAVTANKVRSVRAAFSRGTTWVFDRETQAVSLRADAQLAQPQPESSAGEVPFRPTLLMERVSRTIEAQPGLSGKGVIAATEGKSTYLRLAMELLTTEGYLEDRGTPRRSTFHSVRAYRDADDPAGGSSGSSNGSQAVPGTVVNTGSLVPPTYKGNKGPGNHYSGEDDLAVPDPDLIRAERLLDEHTDLDGGDA